MLPGRFKVAELELVGEAAKDGGIEMLHEVRRPDHDALEPLHAVQQFVHLRDFPVGNRAGAILHQPVEFVEKENRILFLRLLECGADCLLRLADPVVEQVARHLHDDFAAELLTEVVHELRLASTWRSPEKKTHARPVRKRRIVCGAEQPEVLHGGHDFCERDVATDG